MRQVLVFGENFRGVAFEIVAMTLLSVTFLAAGVVLYGRIKLSHT